MSSASFLPDALLRRRGDGGAAARDLPIRPGFAAGPQPERAERSEPRLAVAARTLAGAFGLPRRARRAAVSTWASRVERAGAGLEALDERAFDSAVAELRRELVRRGLAAELLPRGFAVVREAARRSLATPHYDVQLFGGRVMARAGLAELETGEGKTLTATLPASLAALAGIPVHVVTANDYLVERDAREMAPLYERLGLRVGFVVEAEPDRDARREAYACDLTYATNKQIAFDYLRDQIVSAGEARLASRPGLDRGRPSEASPVLRRLCFGILDEADGLLIDDACTPLILSGDGAPADEPIVRAATELASRLEAGSDFELCRATGRVSLTPGGRERLAEMGRDVPGPLSGERRRAEWVERALRAEHLYERDRHYLVNEDAVEVIDQPTGRRAPDRAFEGGIQSLIELREGLPLTPQRTTLARISYQRFFRRYLRLAGMTGTAREVSSELFRVYGLRTTVVPTRVPSRRIDRGCRIHATIPEQLEDIALRVASLHAEGRPVLVGTASLEASERVSARLDESGLSHRVLSARQDREEAEVVAAAGERGRITVATRMAGRGTDVKPGEGVDEIGGLAVLSTERGEARRIDRQLFGRCGRQGAPGSHEEILSLADPLIEQRAERWRPLLARPRLARLLGACLLAAAQRQEEASASRARRRLMAAEGVLKRLLAFSGRST